jgi:hypothetical protein
MKQAFFVLALIWVLATPLRAFAFGDVHDEYSLDLKGFSPEMIQITETSIDRMEGRYPAAAPSRPKQLWYNFLNANWIEPVKPFEQDTVQPPLFPIQH